MYTRTSVTHPPCHIPHYHCDAANHLNSVIVAKPTPSTFGYSPHRLLLNITDTPGTLAAYTYDGVGNALTAGDANGNVTQLQYDENDNVRKLIDALSGQTSTTYDAEDHPLTVTDANNHTRTMTYDEVGNLKTL